MAKNNIRLIEPFNPLDKRYIGKIVAEQLLSSDITSLPPEPFIGAGVYVIYYTGSFSAYKTLSDLNKSNQLYPIYIGKAVPAGSRKGGLGEDVYHGTALYKRLVEHSETIKTSSTLKIEDFKCQFLVVDDIWIPLTESLLIERFRPVWNCMIDGFGNHDPGKGRYNQQKSHWDCLHPGRQWADKLQPSPFTDKELKIKVEEYLLSSIK